MVEFRDPAPQTRATARTKVDEALDELASNPGTWGVVGTYKSRASASVAGTRWRKKAASRGDFDFMFTAREGEGGIGELFGIALVETAAVELDTEKEENFLS